MEQKILYVNFSGCLFSFVLPTENNRTYDIDLTKYINYTDCKITLEYFDSVWKVKSNNHISIIDNNSLVESQVLLTGKLAYCRLYNTTNFSLLLDTLSQEHLHYSKLDISSCDKIILGKDLASDIVLHNEYISNKHAIFTKSNNDWFVEDDSKNGMYLNGQRIQVGTRIKLRIFDVIYTGGFKIIFLKDCIAINHRKSFTTKLKEYNVGSCCGNDIEHTPYLRSPRTQEPLPTDLIEIEGPPSKQTHKRQPLIFVLGPALTTPLPMLTTMMLRMTTSSYGTGTYWAMGVSVVLSALIGLGWTMARRKYDAKEELINENQRQEAYKTYLSKNETLLISRHDECKKNLLSQYPSSSEIAKKLFAGQLSQFLWNRNPIFEDFAKIRLGIGETIIPGGIQIPKARFSVTNDLLAEEPAILKEKYRLVRQVPALADLRGNKLIGIIGSKNDVNELACNIVIQLATLHSYTDVRIAFLYDAIESESYRWARWLQHTFTPDKKIKLIGEDITSKQNILSFLMDLMRRREKANDDNNTAGKLPFYVVFCREPEVLYNHAIYKLMTDSNDYGVTFVLLYEKIDYLPNECTYLIQSNDEYKGQYSLELTRDETNIVDFDYLKPSYSEQIARMLSKYWVNEIADGELPERVEFLEMYDISDINNWDLMKRWKESRTYESIKGQIGYTYGRTPVFLDIHEKQHGPHGLVAGTTGSGKSETIQTFILSLMMNYHPSEVSFVLIDYKGGGMANLFADSPHIAGTITNLATSGDNADDSKTDVIQTKRALASLKSEIKQRQKIFNSYGVNHIDAYNRLYRDGVASIAIPHLIIISDEFAELKKEQPDFIKELISAARVGRSLGIHLILATQKPSGVVDDEIWSNSRFKLCLRVQDKQDSMEMLKRPEAAELSRIGQGYMQIGNDEIFELFQSGYSGADYVPQDDLDQKRQNKVEILMLNGAKIRQKNKQSKNEKLITQLEACVKYIRKTADKFGVENSRSLWLPMLSNKISLESLFHQVQLKDTYTAILGVIDYPEQQSQPIFSLTFPECGHVLVVGNSGSGKSTLINTIIASLSYGLAPEDFNWYALDFSNHAFDNISKLTHCGGVIYPEDDEKIDRLFSHLNATVKKRKQLLAESGCLTAKNYRDNKKGFMPLIVIALDNYAGYMEANEKYADVFQKLLREGIACGIHFIVSINTSSDMRNKIMQNFSTTIPLKLNERSDYYNYLGTMPQVNAMSDPGGGLYTYQGTIVQFQSAYVCNEDEIIKSACLSKCGYRAEAIKYIDKAQTYADYLSFLDSHLLCNDFIPLGWFTRDITPYGISLREDFCYFISDTVGSGYSSLLTNIISYADVQNIELHYVCSNRKSADSTPYAKVYISFEDVYFLMSYLREVFKERADALKAYKAKGGVDCETFISSNFDNILVVFEDYNSFCDMTYAASNDKSYSAAFEAFLKNGKGFGVTFVAYWNKLLYSRNFAKPACQLFADARSGVHIGGKLDTQKVIETNMSITEQSKIRPPETGFALNGHKVSQVYFPPAELNDTTE